MSMFKTMQKGAKGALTLFHDPSSKASEAILASIKKQFPDPQESNIDLEVTKERPTDDQIRTIAAIDQTVDFTKFSRPLLVDWFNGKLARDESTAERIFEELRKNIR